MTEFERSLVRIAAQPEELPDQLTLTVPAEAWSIAPSPGRLSACLIRARVQLERAGFYAQIVRVIEGRAERMELRAHRRQRRA